MGDAVANDFSKANSLGKNKEKMSLILCFILIYNNFVHQKKQEMFNDIISCITW